MAEVTFSNAAVTDLADIDEFSLARFGEDIAEAYMLGFKEAFAKLRDHPLAAPARPDLGSGIRCLVHRQHRILYTTDGKRVIVLRVTHHAMDARTALKGAAG